MKKMKIKRTFSLVLLLLLLVCGSSWAANFSFTDPSGQWWSGSDFSITFDWSAGPLLVTAVGGDLSPNGTGDVEVSLNTANPLLEHYSLDASAISSMGGNGPLISVINIPFAPSPFTEVLAANGSDNFFVAWDLTTKTIMLYDGDPLGSCYTYLGLDFSDDLAYSPASDTSMTFTSAGVEAIFGQQRCNCVPIPGAIWILSSGLFGLFCIRRKNRT